MSGIKEKVAIGFGVGLGISAISGVYYWYKLKIQNACPKNWRKVGTISKVAFSPIKSCQIVCLNEAECKLMGIESGRCRDHMLMLIDDTNKVVTARGYPKMLKIKQTPTKDGLEISALGVDPLKIQFVNMADGPTLNANIFTSPVYVVECGKQYSRWFSQVILNQDEGLRLVYYPHQTPTRAKPSECKNSIFKRDDTGTLHDVSSFMLINETSVEELNTRLKNPVNPMQFRPNFLVKTDGLAYDEDNWSWIKIGNDAVFRTVMPCYRCILPNINLETAERDEDGEPLKTLKTYRLDGESKSPVMGLQLGLRTAGTVKVGDEVFVGV